MESENKSQVHHQRSWHNILFNSLVNSTINCSPLSNTILFSNSCNFHTLSLNHLANISTDVFSIVVIKYIILDNLSHTTSIVSFSVTNSNLVIKDTSMAFLVLYSISTSLLVPLFYSLLSGICYNHKTLEWVK